MRKPFLNYLAFVLLFSTAVSAQIPKTISYQGVLADTNGNAVADGNYNLTFRIYNVASGGTEIWTETQTLSVADGIFNAILGSATPLNLAFDQPYWLGISVEGGTELSPRIELTSAPYSLQQDSGGGGDGHSLDAADGNPTDVVYVDNSGRVGIGTTTPKQLLHVSGDYYGKGHLYLYAYEGDGNSGTAYIQGRDDSGVSNIDMRLRTQNAGSIVNAMTIKNDGKIGIGTVAPNSNTKLHVASHERYSGYFTSDSMGYLTHVIHAEYNGPSGPDDVIAVYGKSLVDVNNGIGGEFEGGYRGISATSSYGNSFTYGVYGGAFFGQTTFGIFGHAYGGSGNNYAVYADGDMAYTGNLINASDAKLKENIRPLAGYLEKLMRLKPKSFNFTSDEQYAHMNLPTGEHYGLIAQEVEQVLPELVSDNSHPSAAESRGEKSDDPPIAYKGLNSMEFIPILIEAVQEQQTIIEKQQEEIEKQQTRINQLESKVNQVTNN